MYLEILYGCATNVNNISYCNMQVNGVNILRLSAKDVYAYGLQLIDVLFTKEEQSRSLLFSSKKSPKPERTRGQTAG